MDLPALRARAQALVPFKRRPRPTSAESFPTHVDQEMRRIDEATRSLVQVCKDLSDRITALGG